MIYDYMHVLAHTLSLSLNYPRYVRYIYPPLSLFFYSPRQYKGYLSQAKLSRQLESHVCRGEPT